MFKSFISDRNVASLIPTSKRGIQSICKSIDFSKDNIFVEYGGGTGVISRYLIRNMTADSLLIIIEKNFKLYSHLKKLENKNVLIHYGCASHIKSILTRYGLSKANYILSGIPFSFITKKQTELILKDTSQSLTNGGMFIVYQYSSMMKQQLKSYFSTIKEDRVLLNLPPLFVMENYI